MKILIIDDNEDYLYLLKENLKKNHEVFTESDPYFGIQSAITNHPDLILLDIFIPKQNGFQILNNLKCYTSTKNIPIIIMSNVDDESLKDMAEISGSKRFLSKNFDLKDIPKICENAV